MASPAPRARPLLLVPFPDPLTLTTAKPFDLHALFSAALLERMHPQVHDASHWVSIAPGSGAGVDPRGAPVPSPLPSTRTWACTLPASRCTTCHTTTDRHRGVLCTC